jgi:hypothetical protein
VLALRAITFVLMQFIENFGDAIFLIGNSQSLAGARLHLKISAVFSNIQDQLHTARIAIS